MICCGMDDLAGPDGRLPEAKHTLSLDPPMDWVGGPVSSSRGGSGLRAGVSC